MGCAKATTLLELAKGWVRSSPERAIHPKKVRKTNDTPAQLNVGSVVDQAFLDKHARLVSQARNGVMTYRWGSPKEGYQNLYVRANGSPGTYEVIQ